MGADRAIAQWHALLCAMLWAITSMGLVWRKGWHCDSGYIQGTKLVPSRAAWDGQPPTQPTKPYRTHCLQGQVIQWQVKGMVLDIAEGSIYKAQNRGAKNISEKHALLPTQLRDLLLAGHTAAWGGRIPEPASPEPVSPEPSSPEKDVAVLQPVDRNKDDRAGEQGSSDEAAKKRKAPAGGSAHKLAAAAGAVQAKAPKTQAGVGR